MRDLTESTCCKKGATTSSLRRASSSVPSTGCHLMPTSAMSKHMRMIVRGKERFECWWVGNNRGAPWFAPQSPQTPTTDTRQMRGSRGNMDSVQTACRDWTPRCCPEPSLSLRACFFLSLLVFVVSRCLLSVVFFYCVFFSVVFFCCFISVYISTERLVGSGHAELTVTPYTVMRIHCTERVGRPNHEH